MPRRKFWGWGYEGEGLTPDEQKMLAALLAERLGADGLSADEPPTIDDLELRPPRVRPPAALESMFSDDPYERAAHTYGKSFRDVVRAFRREYPNPPDLVAFPADEGDVGRVLEWCEASRLAVIPYGGGSSVVGGVELPPTDSHGGAVSLDLRRLDRVLEVDQDSRAARIQAGALGPHLEEQLKPHGLTLRHFPQSFPLSSLGGWIATRSGGHYATLYTHIDDFVEALRVVTPRGLVATRRLPGSGAGPQPDRLFMGSEGALGVITEAWMRLQDRPRFRASAAATYARFEDGVEACRALSQSGLFPSNCRLLDPTEAQWNRSGEATTLVFGFESADHDVEPWMARALELCRDHGGEVPEEATGGDESARSGSVGAWRDAFIKMPHIRDSIVAMGQISETFETALTWDRFPAFHERVVAAVTEAIRSECGRGWISCRFTHVYPDGPAPYYSVIAQGTRERQLEQYEAIKRAASEVIVEFGATITHHHAVGRDHREWYDREIPPLFGDALRAAKARLDPAGIMNPGVLVDI